MIDIHHYMGPEAESGPTTGAATADDSAELLVEDQGANQADQADQAVAAELTAPVASSLAAQQGMTRDELVVKYTPLVHHIVRGLQFSLPPMLDTDDLVSYGTMGLLNAIERFDTAHGVKFQTYAATRIRGYIIDQLRALDWIPRSTRQRTRQIERARDELVRTLGRLPTADEVARHMGLGRAKYDQAMRDASTVTLSLDALLYPAADDAPGNLLSSVQDESNPSPDASLEAHDLQVTVSSALDTLSEREQRLLRLYYFEERTLHEISRVLEVSESRVCQLHTQALKRLRTVIAA